MQQQLRPSQRNHQHQFRGPRHPQWDFGEWEQQHQRWKRPRRSGPFLPFKASSAAIGGWSVNSLKCPFCIIATPQLKTSQHNGTWLGVWTIWYGYRIIFTGTQSDPETNPDQREHGDHQNLDDSHLRDLKLTRQHSDLVLFHNPLFHVTKPGTIGHPKKQQTKDSQKQVPSETPGKPHPKGEKHDRGTEPTNPAREMAGKAIFTGSQPTPEYANRPHQPGSTQATRYYNIQNWRSRKRNSGLRRRKNVTRSFWGERRFMVAGIMFAHCFRCHTSYRGTQSP